MRLLGHLGRKTDSVSVTFSYLIIAERRSASMIGSSLASMTANVMCSRPVGVIEHHFRLFLCDSVAGNRPAESDSNSEISRVQEFRQDFGRCHLPISLAHLPWSAFREQLDREQRHKVSDKQPQMSAFDRIGNENFVGNHESPPQRQ